MDAPPDEKAVQELTTATRGRTAGGKWRIVVAVLLLAALVVVGFAVVTESIRQSGISSAKKEAREAAEAVQARYAHVNDWPAWYRNRLPKNWGGDKLQAWIDAAQPVFDKRGDLVLTDLLVAMEWELGGIDDASPPADKAKVAEILREIEPLIPGLSALASYECLALLPNFADGFPGYRVIPVLSAFKLIRFRIAANMFLGNWDTAWQELLLLHEVVKRMGPASSIVPSRIVYGMEKWCMDLVALGLRHVAAPREILEQWAVEPPQNPDRLLELVDVELAMIAQASRLRDSEEWIADFGIWSEEVPDSSGWFGYLQPELSWRERKQAWSGPQESAEFAAGYMNGMLAAADELRAGVKPEQIRVEADVWFYQQVRLEAEMTLRRRFTACLARARLAELDHADEAALQDALDTLAAEFPELELERTSGGIFLKYRDTPDNRKQLSYDEQDSKSFHEANPPVTLKPLKP